LRLEDLVGLDLLVGKTFFDGEGSVLRQEQFHGEVVESEAGTTWVRPSDGGDRQWVPAALAAFRPAPCGDYRLASTGRVVVDPLLLTSWMYTVLHDERGETYYEAEPNYAPLRQSRVPAEWDLTYRVREDRIRRIIDLFGDQYIAKTLLLGVTHTGPDGVVRRHEQCVATILWVAYDDGIVVACDPDGRQMTLPGDPCWMEKAPQGEYQLRSTGRIVKDPDYIASLTHAERE